MRTPESKRAAAMVVGVAAVLLFGGCHSAPGTSVVTTPSTTAPAVAPSYEPSVTPTPTASAATETRTPAPARPPAKTGTPKPSRSARPTTEPSPSQAPPPAAYTDPPSDIDRDCLVDGKDVKQGDTAPMDGGKDYEFVVQCDQFGNTHVVKRYMKPTSSYYAQCWGPHAEPGYAQRNHNICGDGPAQ